jgi:N-acetylglucosamine-6-sulfatase
MSLLYVSLLLVACSSGEPDGPDQEEEHSEEREVRRAPNFVLVLVDDMRADELGMVPRLRTLLGEKGTTFENSFVTNPVCCPSRATLLTGLYSHNHGVMTNLPPSGGYERFVERGLGERTLVALLDRHGYRTALYGKYLNGYAGEGAPPGWDEWGAFAGSPARGFAILTQGGEAQRLAPGAFVDDLAGSAAEAFVREGGPQPFFLALWLTSPHTPYRPPPRHADSHEGQTFRRPPSFNEANVSDKPGWLRAREPLEEWEADRTRRGREARLEELEAVADHIGDLLGALEDRGELGDTYVLFTSDNGVALGEHRVRGKGSPYEESVRVPLVVRGPGVPEGETRDELVLNNDVAPTVADWAGLPGMVGVDGRSLSPLLSDGTDVPWRDAFLVEHRKVPGSASPPITTYRAVRTAEHLYVEYETGEEELYDLRRDPYQLESVHDTAGSRLLGRLRGRLEALEGCQGQACRKAERPRS